MVFKAVYTLFVKKRYMFHSNTFFKLRLVCFGLPPAATSGEVAAGEPKKKEHVIIFSEATGSELQRPNGGKSD